MSSITFQIIYQTEYSISINFSSLIDEDVLAHVVAIQQEIIKRPFEGFIETVPSYNSLTVYYDPIIVSKSNLSGLTPSEKITSYLRKFEGKTFLKVATDKIIHIPVCYDESLGLDINELSKVLNVTINEIAQLHSQKIYTVYMVGFTPGFPYLGTIHTKLNCTRKQTPRKEVPAGSVGIAGKQTGIYPSATPGGWQIIGRTPLKLFSIEKNPPALLQPGDRVKFSEISLQEFKQAART